MLIPIVTYFIYLSAFLICGVKNASWLIISPARVVGYSTLVKWATDPTKMSWIRIYLKSLLWAVESIVNEQWPLLSLWNLGMAEKQLYLVHLNNVLLTALSTPFHVCVDVDPIRPPSLTMDITHTQDETYPYPTFGHVDAFHGIFQLLECLF